MSTSNKLWKRYLSLGLTFYQGLPIAIAVMLLPLILTAIATETAYIKVSQDQEYHFNELARNLQDSIAKRLNTYEELLRGGLGLFNASESVTREQWSYYVKSVNIETRYPGIFGLGFITYVTNHDKEQFLLKTRADGIPDFNISPAGDRKDYFIVTYIEPLQKNRSAIGFDIGADNFRREFTEKAIDTGEPCITGKIELLQDPDKNPAFLLLIPFYQRGISLNTIEDRRKAFQGFIYAPFLVKELMKGIFSKAIPELDFEIFDGEVASAATLLYDDDLVLHAVDKDYHSSFKSSVKHLFSQRNWIIHITTRPVFDINTESKAPLLIFTGGLTISLLIFGIVWSLLSTRSRSILLAQKMTYELRMSQTKLQSNEMRTTLIINNMLEGLITLNQMGIIESINPAIETIFGYQNQELIDQHCQILFVKSLEKDIPLEKTILGKAIGQLTEWEGKRKDGELFTFELSLFSYQTSSNQGLAASIRDISKLSEVDRLKKEFISTVSHELRTPLTSIKGSLSLLSSNALGDLPEEAQEVVDIAERNTTRLISLINDILDLEKLGNGKLEFSFDYYDLYKLCLQACESLKAFAEEHAIIFKIEPFNIQIYADGKRIVQVLINFLSNAVKFSLDNSKIIISASENEHFITVQIEDFGCGIAEQYQAEIFERFHQIEGSDSREKGGTGLGLAICKAIIEQHKGSIGVKSSVGTGSIFWFRIPNNNKREFNKIETVKMSFFN